MSLMAMPLHRRGPFTRDDLRRTPDDGRRYELIDGELYVSNVPAIIHQLAAINLAMTLRQAAPKGYRVLMAPVAVVLAPDTEIQPDIVVGRREDYGSHEIATPVLVVEVLSPSTRLYDMNTKLRRFERAGTPSFWVVDPVADPAEATLVAWELGPDGSYRQVAKATGETPATLAQPFPVTIVPADLVRD